MGPKLNQARVWGSNGHMAEVGKRWLVVCGSMVLSVIRPCESLDILATPLKWEIIGTTICMVGIATVSYSNEWLIITGGLDIKRLNILRLCFLIIVIICQSLA